MLTVHRIIFAMGRWIARMADEPLIGNYSTPPLPLGAGVITRQAPVNSFFSLKPMHISTKKILFGMALIKLN